MVRVAQENRPDADRGHYDDTELMRQIAAGESWAFDLLVRRHLPRAVRTARGILGSDAEAEDVAQESFLRLWRHASSWISAEEAGAKFSTWFYKVIVNLCIDHKRKRAFVPLDDIPEPLDARGNAEAEMQRNQEAIRVQKSIARLPDRQRAAFVLCFYEECSNREAAEILGIGVKALESLLVRARKQLYNDLANEVKQP